MAANKLFKCIVKGNLNCVTNLFDNIKYSDNLIENGKINNVFDYKGGQTFLDIAKEEKLNDIVEFLKSKALLHMKNSKIRN